MFGQQKPFGQQTTFGPTGGFGSTFGQTPQQTGTGLFSGSKPTVSFGTTAAGQTGGLFGTPASTFGATSAVGNTGGSLFGGTSTFSTPATNSLFGNSTQAKPSLFGTTTTTPFGATAPAANTGFAFGGTANTGGLFGQQQQQQTSTASNLFGATAQSATTGGNLFGSTMMGTQQNGTTVKFNPKIDTDTMLKNNMQQNIQTKHQCIAAMKEYENKSLEELRVEDYLANRKGPQAGQAGFTFGSTLGQPQQQQQQQNLFGTATTTAASIFGQQNKSLFGGTNAFGTATSSAAGTNLFGQPQQQQQATGLFGANKSLFGAPTTTTSTFSFSTPTATTGGLFGQQQPTQSIFGATAPQQTGIFGAQPQQQTGTIFGAPQNNTVMGFPQQQGQNLFGGTTSFAPASSAFNAFGQQQATAPAFGQQQQAGGLFGTKPATTTATPFGTTNTFGGGGFGTGFGQPAQQNIFGAAQPQQQKPLFGNTFGTQQPAFGTGTNATTGAGLFGQSPFGATGVGGQGLFGTQQQKPTINFGNAPAFGTGAMNYGGMMDPSQAVSLGTNYNAELQQQELLRQQLFGLSTSPYGDRLFSKGRKSDDLPAPTDPLAQKRIMDIARSSTGFFSGSHASKPLPPFKPVSRLMVTSPSYGRQQQETNTVLQGIDSDTISFTEGFIPKKNIKKLTIQPKVSDGSTNNRSLSNAPNVATSRNTSFPENRTLTTAVRSNGAPGIDRSTVQALNFDNTTDSEGRNGLLSATSSVLHGNSYISEDRGHTNEQRPNREQSIIISDTSPTSSAAVTTASSTNTSPIEKASPNSVSESSQAPSSPDENFIESNHPAGIILTRADYFTIPSMKELEKIFDRSTGQCNVDGFTVGRTGYGSIFWMGKTNVVGLNLDELVHFRHKEVTVYPDDEKRPPVGTELNKKAEITLERVWPVDKTTRLPIKDVKRLEAMNYRDKLEKATAQMDADFVDYRPEIGAWVFRVPHFSKYGLMEEADEEQPSMMELETTQQQQPVQDKVQRLNLKAKKTVQKNGFSVQRSIVDVGFSLDADARGLGGTTVDDNQFTDEDEVLTDTDFDGDIGMGKTELMMPRGKGETMLFKSTAATSGLFPEFFKEIRQSDKFLTLNREMGTCFDDELQDFVVEPSSRRMKKQPLLTELHEKSLLLLRKTDDESAIIELSQQQQPAVVPSPASSFIGQQRSDALFLTRPRNTVRLVPYEQSITCNRSRFLLDASLFNGRRFRIGWAPLGIIASKNHLEIEDGNFQTGLLFGAGKSIAGPREFSVALSKSIPDTRSTILADLDVLLKCQSELSDFESAEQMRCSQLIPTEDGQKSLNAYLEMGKEMKDSKMALSIFQLCQTLWGKLADDETREDLVSQWIIEQCRESINEMVEELKRKGHQYLIEALFCLLTSRRLEEAAELAQQAGDWRLSLIINQMWENIGETKAMWLKQLQRWSEIQADKFIDTTRLKIYMLAAGLLTWKTSDGRMINACENLDWKRTFGLHLWYACAPFSTILRAIDQYDAAWRNPNQNVGQQIATQPLAAYIESDPNVNQVNRQWKPESNTRLDVSYHLLRLFADRSYPIYTVLETSMWTSDPFNFYLSWHLWCILRSLGLVIVGRGNLDTLHAQYAFQLERKGMWQRGIFVALHTDDRYRREALVKQLLAQHVRNCSKDDADVLVEEFFIPIDWILIDKTKF